MQSFISRGIVGSLFVTAALFFLIAPSPVHGQDLAFDGQHFAFQQGGFVEPPTKGNCDPRFCHEFGNCLVDGGFGDISISPHQVSLGETLTISFTGEASPPAWPAVLTGPPSTGGRGGRYIRWQNETLCGGPSVYPVLTRVGTCAGASCDYELTSTGSMDVDADLGGRPWAIVRLEFWTALGLAWDEDYFGVVGEGPTADFEFEISDDNPLEVQFDASNSSDPEDNLVEYAWDFDGDGTDDETTDLPTITFTYEEEGTYDVTLTVRDGDDLEDDITKDVEVKAARMRYVVEIGTESDEGGNKTTQDDDPQDIQIGATVLVKVAVENNGAVPLEEIKLAGGLEGIEIVSDPEGALNLLGARQLTIDRLEPGEEGEIVVAYEAVHAAQFSVLVTKIEATATDPNTNERTTVEAEATPTCEIGQKTRFSPFDDGENDNVGCASDEIKPGDLLVNSFASTEQAAGLDPVRDGCSTGTLIMRDGVEETECTLAAAVKVANERSEQGQAVTIRFDIPGNSHIIALDDILTVTGNVTIDATTQPGYSTVPAIRLVASGTTPIAFDLRAAATVCGFEIQGFQTGIRVTGADATISHNVLTANAVGIDVVVQETGNNGTTIEDNTIGGSTTAGIQIAGQFADGNKILKNRIGTDPSGQAADGNQIGILMQQARGTLISENLISGSAGAGIRIEGGSSNTIQRNLIGTNQAGTAAIPNRVGISIDNSSDNVIGGSMADRNTIGGNTTYSITIIGTGEGLSTSNNVIQSNYVGLNQQGSEALGIGNIALIDTRHTTVGGPNGGNYFASLAIEGGEEHFIVDNYIGVNVINDRRTANHEGSGVSLSNTLRAHVERNIIRGKGVAVFLSNDARRTAILDNLIYDNSRGVVLDNAYEGNTIRRNRMYDITSLGIDYYNNYRPEADERRPHRFPEPPKLFLAQQDDGNIVVTGRVPRGDSEQYTIDVYLSEACNSSRHGTGAAHIESIVANERAIFQISAPGGPSGNIVTVTATAYNPNQNGSPDGGTTEYSACVDLTSIDRTAQAGFDAQSTGPVIDANGVRMGVFGSSATTASPSTLFAARFIAQPDDNVFSGSATSHDGVTRTPQSTMFRYYALQVDTDTEDDTLPVITHDLCLDVTGLTNGAFFERILLLQRNETTDGVWIPHNTSLIQEAGDIRYVCAESVQGFGEFGFSLGTATALAPPLLVAPENGTTATSEVPLLQWTGVDGAARYEVEVARTSAFSTVLFTAADIETTTVEATTEGPGLTHYWRVRAFAATGEAGPWSLPWSFTAQGTPVDTETDDDLPAQFVLEGNYPNPFNPQTTITYSLPQTTEVHLGVYDALGREITVLADGMQPAGRHEVVFEAVDLPSGVYLYRLVASGQVRTGRMVLLK